MADETKTTSPDAHKDSKTSNVVANSKVEASLIRWLESQSFGDYVSGLEKLDIVSLSNLLSLTHSQLIEVARQLGMKPLKTVLFVEAIVSNKEYTQRHTISEGGDVALAYKVLSIINRLSKMGIRDNWDIASDDLYSLIDVDSKNKQSQRELIGYIEEALTIDKNNYVAWDIHGLLHARRGFLADARVCFQKSLVWNPNYLHARFNHARLLHYELGKYDSAKSEYECIIRVQPNFSRAYNSYAKLLEKMGDFENAEKYFRHAIKLRPKSVSYRHYLANILASQKRHLQVQQVYQEAVSQHPRSATLRFHHALSLVKCKYYKEAEQEFENALKLNSNSAQMYHEYGKFCERYRNPPDYKKAIDYYFKAMSLDPINFLDAAVDAANLMRRLDTKSSRTSAEQLFKKLIIEAPHLVGAWLGYAKLLVREERLNEAKSILKAGIRNNPNDKPLIKYNNEFLKALETINNNNKNNNNKNKNKNNKNSSGNNDEKEKDKKNEKDNKEEKEKSSDKKLYHELAMRTSGVKHDRHGRGNVGSLIAKNAQIHDSDKNMQLLSTKSNDNNNNNNNNNNSSDPLTDFRRSYSNMSNYSATSLIHNSNTHLGDSTTSLNPNKASHPNNGSNLSANLQRFSDRFIETMNSNNNNNNNNNNTNNNTNNGYDKSKHKTTSNNTNHSNNNINNNNNTSSTNQNHFSQASVGTISTANNIGNLGLNHSNSGHRMQSSQSSMLPSMQASMQQASGMSFSNHATHASSTNMSNIVDHRNSFLNGHDQRFSVLSDEMATPSQFNPHGRKGGKNSVYNQNTISGLSLSGQKISISAGGNGNDKSRPEIPYIARSMNEYEDPTPPVPFKPMQNIQNGASIDYSKIDPQMLKNLSLNPQAIGAPSNGSVDDLERKDCIVM